jgi:hypothetical protein
MPRSARRHHHSHITKLVPRMAARRFSLKTRMFSRQTTQERFWVTKGGGRRNPINDKLRQSLSDGIRQMAGRERVVSGESKCTRAGLI